MYISIDSKSKKSKHRELLKGIFIARDCPSVSHLLFEYDSLFFCQANLDKSKTILKILSEYERASGQQINYEKSSIQFGHSVSQNVKAKIQDIIKIKTIGGMGTYLGLLEGMGGAKPNYFAFVQGKHHERINSWSTTFLSKGGKEVLIKLVETALPTYVMSCYRIPK